MNARAASPLTSGERESFFAAQARYRAAARRWSIVMTLVVFAVTLVISLLLAPIAFALIGLVMDLVNLAVPAPDLLGALGRLIDALNRSHASIPVARIAAWSVIAALPGFLILLAVWARLGRIALDRHRDALRAGLGLRDPRREDLEELRLCNLVEEMSIAASRPPPRVELFDSDACNLGLLGDDQRAAIIVTRGLIDRLDREESQALIGQAIAALGNGDGLLAERLLHLDMMIGLLMLLAQAPLDKGARAALRPLLRIRRGADAASDVAALRSALGDTASVTDDSSSSGSASSWRDWAMMPLMGSMLIGILIVPISTMLFVAPLNGLIWRRRRLLADAMAVQFTRDPAALANAYVSLSKQETKLDLRLRSPGELFLLDAKAASNMSLGSPYPSFARRIERLNAMGAGVEAPARTHVPLWLWAAIAPLAALILVLLGFVIVMGTWLSLAINGLFLALPTALIHAALRALGHG